MAALAIRELFTYLSKRDSKDGNGRSGQRSVDEWEGRIRNIFHSEMAEMSENRDMRIREIIRDELSKSR